MWKKGNSRRTERKLPGYALSTALGLGYFPHIPGTFASFATVGVVAILYKACDFANIILWVSFLVLLPISIRAADCVARWEGKTDPPNIVIDEVLGQIFCLFWVPFSWPFLGMGFVAFRIFDIFKPYPIKKVERLQGGMGIVCDDLVAGLYAGLILRVVYAFTSQQ